MRESADLKFRAQAIAPELDRDNNLRSRMEQILACRGRVVLLDLLGRSMNNFTTLPFTRKVILTRLLGKNIDRDILTSCNREL